MTKRVSVIMPVERTGGDAERAIAAVMQQQDAVPFELLIVSATPPASSPSSALVDVRSLVVGDRNPALRRNRAAALAEGDVLAFIDDDAFADAHWLSSALAFLDENPDVLAVGGPDPAPDDSTPAELLSDTLLRTRWIGSGIAAHEDRPGTFPVSAGSDIALVNLFIRRSAFDAAGGFDESIGYIGEDSALIELLRKRGRVMYHSAIRVQHRRRAFPGPYLRQRWRYRVKTGQMLRLGAAPYRRSGKIRILLGAGLTFLAALILWPAVAASMLLVYLVTTLALALPVTRLPLLWRPLIPFAFLLHHATYFGGIVWGFLRGPGRSG